MSKPNLSLHGSVTSRRCGLLLIGTFAGLCSAFVPRLALVIQSPERSPVGNLQVFTENYVFAGVAFAFLIGGAVLILKWNAKDSPSQIFMAALGIPALLTGAFNSVEISHETVRVADELKKVNDERTIEQGISVETTPQRLPVSDGPRSLLHFNLVQTAFAQDSTRQVPSLMVQQQKVADLGVRYSQTRYWVALYSASTKTDAERKAIELGSRYGKVKIQQFDSKYLVSLEGGPFPYSEAVSKAVELKRTSKDTLRPTLVQAK